MENLAMLQQIVGFPISERTLYRYCHDRGIALATLSDDDILANLDISMSVRGNQKLFADMGMKVGKDRISHLLKLITPILPSMNGVDGLGVDIHRRLGFDRQWKKLKEKT